MAKVFTLLFVIHLVLIGQEIDAYEPTHLDRKIERIDNGLPNISDRPVQSNNVNIFADVLYWYTTETIDWALILSQDQNSQILDYKTISFDWAVGFRVGIGYNMKHDWWDTQLYYTWFQTQTADHAKGGSGVVASAFLGNRTAEVGTYQSGKINWKLNFNMFDWELGRSFLVSKFLSLRPFIGLKGGWIDQRIQSKWQKEIDILGFKFMLVSMENLKNDFVGGGPKIGVNGKWILGHIHQNSFSLFGDFAVALMWGHWTIKDKFRDNLITTVTVKVGTRNFGSLMLQSFTGIRWDVNFRKEQSHIAVKLGYEIQDWFNHYQILDNSTGTHNNDLILQGITLDMRFDF